MKTSILESRILNYNVCRLDSKDSIIAIQGLDENLKAESVDICRIKVTAEDQNVLETINSLGYPWQMYNVNYCNKLAIPDTKKLDTAGFSSRQVIDNSKDIEFISILEDVVKHNTWMEYQGGLSSFIFSEKLNYELARNYYSAFNISTHPQSYTAVLYKEKEAIGLYMGEFQDETFYGSLFGIVKKYRQSGYAKYFYEFMFETCRNKEIKYFKTDVNVFNFGSQQSALSKGFLPQSIHFNLTIFPFLNCSSNRFKDLKLTTKDEYNIYRYLDEQFLLGPNRQIKVKEHLAGEIDELKYALIQDETKQKFIVIHGLREHKLLKSWYIERYK